MGKLFFFGFLGLVVSWLMLHFIYSDENKLNARKYRLDPAPALIGALKLNEKLSKASLILENKIVGPESMAIVDDAIYASLYDARVVKIVDGEIIASVSYSERAQFFRDCGNFDAEPTCGRPLGIRQLSSKSLKFLVADAYLGVYLIDFNDEKNPKHEEIFSSKIKINGITPKFLNDLDIINEDEFVVSDSSTRHDRRHFMEAILEHKSDGRIIHYKISTKTATVLIDKLYFPNGIQLLPDKKSLLFAECSYARIKKLNLESKKAEMFAANLPGMPDNIRMTERGTFWVGLAAVRHSEAPSIVDLLGAYPGIRQFLIDVIPAKLWGVISGAFKRSHAIIIELDKNGNIIQSLHDKSGKIVDVSQVTEYKNNLYIGSFDSHSIGKLKL
ncbi:unnamed protein product [Caenorhabditis bovis]|uniref:Strictosidine synthase conserved region domain-containing protein n=1 Tax=Caenorhabditis bovis TaxID=2654633 RepID=A0A8S1ENY2_9PELO|nr:unnamed protein product [Caenorhabditis bovis]